jgi:hypothetical protein
MRSTNKNATGNENGSKVIERFKQISHKDKDPVIIKIDEIEHPPFYKNKYFAIIGGLLVGSFIS